MSETESNYIDLFTNCVQDVLVNTKFNKHIAEINFKKLKNLNTYMRFKIF